MYRSVLRSSLLRGHWVCLYVMQQCCPDPSDLITYFSVSVGLGPGHGFTRPFRVSAQLSQIEVSARLVAISRLNSRRVHFQAHVFVGRVRFLGPSGMSTVVPLWLLVGDPSLSALSHRPLQHGSFLYPSV